MLNGVIHIRIGQAKIQNGRKKEDRGDENGVLTPFCAGQRSAYHQGAEKIQYRNRDSANGCNG